MRDLLVEHEQRNGVAAAAGKLSQLAQVCRFPASHRERYLSPVPQGQAGSASQERQRMLTQKWDLCVSGSWSVKEELGRSIKNKTGFLFCWENVFGSQKR